MLTSVEHLDYLTRHIKLVRDATLLLGKRLIAQGRVEHGWMLIGRGFVHDASKFRGIERDFLHAGDDVPRDKLDLAIRQHVMTNDHHPECHGGFNKMPELCVAEMACDLYARTQEFGTSLVDWITQTGVEKYKMDLEGEQYKWLQHYVGILLKNNFVK